MITVIVSTQSPPYRAPKRKRALTVLQPTVTSFGHHLTKYLHLEPVQIYSFQCHFLPKYDKPSQKKSPTFTLLQEG